MTDLPDLAAERFGGSVVACSDEFFGAAARLLQAGAPVARPRTYDEHGQWMDGWETRRHRAPDSDWVVVRLGAPGVPRTLVIDTAHFWGNQPDGASVDGANLPGNPSPEEVLAADWNRLLPLTSLEPNSAHILPVEQSCRVTHVRLWVHPDGGVARFRVHGEAVPDPTDLDGMPLDLAAAVHGGLVTGCSDMHFGRRGNLVAPGEPRSMGEGWETRRRRTPGQDWALVRLASEGLVRRLVVDTRQFRGNAPRSCDVEMSRDGATWAPLVMAVRLQPHQEHSLPVHSSEPVCWLRLTVHPDGGVARLRAWGVPTPQGRRQLALRWLDSLAVVDAERVLLSCCGSRRWASEMAARRPFGDDLESDGLSHLEQVGATVWDALGPPDRMEALAAHPRIGDRPPPGSQESREQSAAQRASPETLAALVEANRAYEERFAMTYLVRAAGRSASEMLDLLHERLGNDRDAELVTAQAQQAEITRLRLRALLDGDARQAG